MNNVIDLAAERRARSGRRRGGAAAEDDLSSGEDHLPAEASTADLVKDRSLHEIATALGLSRDSLL